MSVVLLTEPFSGGGGGSGTVTSVDVVGGTTGLTTSGGPVTTAGVITLGGTLGVPNGGTGAVSLTGILKGTGTTPITIATAGTDYQSPITLTTTGTSGAATFVGNTLNIPQYSGGGGSPAGSDKQIQFNAAGSFGASANLTWDGFTLFVGGNTPVGGLTNPIAAFVQSSPNYIQTYTHNDNAGSAASSDFVVYPDNGSESSGWGDFGVASSGFADATYSITGPNETYLFASGTTGKTGNLVYATDSTGTTNAHQWYVGGFTQAKSAWKMQLTSSGLQLATALSIANGGTGQTTANDALNALLPSQTGNTNYYLKTDGTNTSWALVSGTGTVTSVSITSANGLAGTVTNPTTTPAITLSTTVTGLLKGNGTAISSAASGTDYAPATSGTSILYGDGAGGFSNVTVGSGLTFAGGTLAATGGGSGTVTSVSVTSANGFAGSVINPTTTPAITISTSVSGLLKGNGTAVSAATAGTDYQAPITLTTTGTSGAATFISNVLNIPQYTGSGTPGGSNTQVQFNNSGSFGGSANFTWDGTNVQLGTQGALRFADADSSNYVAFKSPATVASNVTWTRPSADGTSAQVLSTNGSGTLSWVTQTGGGGGSPNLDGGTPTSNYGGITAIDGGTP